MIKSPTRQEDLELELPLAPDTQQTLIEICQWNELSQGGAGPAEADAGCLEESSCQLWEAWQESRILSPEAEPGPARLTGLKAGRQKSPLQHDRNTVESSNDGAGRPTLSFFRGQGPHTKCHL